MRVDHLSELASYWTQARAWRPIELRYTLTLQQTERALAQGDMTDRPALMDVPKPSGDTSTYTNVVDFGTDTGPLRRAVRYSVPTPGRRLAGLRLASVSLIRVRGPGRAVDSWPVATLVYSSDPTHLGLGDSELVLNAASPRRGWGASYATSFFNSSERLTGAGCDARLANESQAILRYRNAYVGIRATWAPTRAQWRAILAQTAH